MERGDFPSPCGTPTGLDSRDLHDLHHGKKPILSQWYFVCYNL